MKIYRDTNYKDIIERDNTTLFENCAFHNVDFNILSRPVYFKNCVIDDCHFSVYAITCEGEFNRFNNCTFNNAERLGEQQKMFISFCCDKFVLEGSNFKDMCLHATGLRKQIISFMDNKGCDILFETYHSGKFFIYSNKVEKMVIDDDMNSINLSDNDIKLLKFIDFFQTYVKKDKLEGILQGLKDKTIGSIEFQNMVFNQCDFSGIDFHTVYFSSYADIKNNQFSQCNLEGCDFSKCQIQGNAAINFYKSNVDGAKFGDNDLYKVGESGYVLRNSRQ